MTIQDISYIHRFLGVVEGVAVSLPENAQAMLFDYIVVVDAILEKKEKEGTNNE